MCQDYHSFSQHSILDTIQYMRIGIYDPYLDDCGGGEKYMMTIAEILSKTHDVSVFWNNYEDLKAVEKRFSLDLAKIKLEKDIFTPTFSKLKRLIASKQYDVIIFHSDGSIPFLLSKKLFIHIQRPIQQANPSIIGKFKLNRVDKIFCNSLFTKSYIDKTFSINSEVIYPPVSFKQRNNKKENKILHVGRFRVFDKSVGSGDFKKQHVMIQIFKEMVDRGFKKWKFTLAVSVQEKDDAAFAEMKNSVKGYPIDFEVNKDNDDLWELYSKSKIYWHASGYGEDLEKKPELAEHFGISTVEAMSAGAVPVVFNAGGQKEIVTDGKNGLLWDTFPECIEETLLVANSKELFNDLSKSAKIRSKDFSNEEFEKKIFKLIRE